MWLDDLLGHLGGMRCLGCKRPGPQLCAECHARLGPHRLDAKVPGCARVVAGLVYEGAARDAVLALKLKGEAGAATILADAIARRVWAEGTRATALAWVPGRRSDIRTRGFDHAEAIARALSRRLGLPATGILERVSDRPDQASLSRSERRTNLEGAFIARSGPARVAVVDDLVTTGSTLSVCARALREAGAQIVEGLIACSTTRNG